MPRKPSGASGDAAARECWSEVFEGERKWLGARHAGHHSFEPQPEPADAPRGSGGRSYLTGICLSGGGIRSATVALGILQAFARHKLIKHFDYMSTVSGGGYIGSALALRYAQARQKASCPDPDAAFPFTARTRTEPENTSLTYLRNHGYYLTPTGVAGTATGALVVARSLLLNLFIWITLGGWLLAGLMGVRMQIGTRCLVLTPRECDRLGLFDLLLFTAFGLGVLLLALMVGFSLSSFRLRKGRRRLRSAPWPLLTLACFALTVLLAYPAFGSLDPRALLGADLDVRLPWFVAATVAFLAMLALGTLSLGLDPRADPGTPSARKYLRRRFQERLSGNVLLWLGLMLVVGSVPILPDLVSRIPFLGNLHRPEAGPLSVLIYLVGLGSALYGYYRTHLRGAAGMGSAFVLVAGSVFLCYGSMVIAYAVAIKFLDLYGSGAPDTLGDAALFVAPLVALALCLFVSINEVSLGGFYRDRLMEAFMPDEQPAAGETGGADGPRMACLANRFLLTDVVEPRSTEKMNGQKPPEGLVGLVGPYPLINANVVTRACSDPVARRRGGDNFVLSPGWCGSSTTSWKPTGAMSEGYLTLANAMAISGAAANPRGGFGGAGPTTGFVVSLAMSLLSIRLGAWLRWEHASRLRNWLNPRGNHLFPSAVSLLPGQCNTWVELSDGGHFENLGIYELVRRRCGLIVVCDGGDDRQASYAALTVAARRIEEDFGATFDLNFRVRGQDGFQPSGPQQIVERKVDDEYPREAEFARRGYFLCSIRYGDAKKARVPMAEDGPSVGLLIYLKSAMIPSLSPTSRGYKGANPEFPHESTVDQFFSPEQFEAYRDVGVCVATQMLEDTRLARLFEGDRRPMIWDLCSTVAFNCAGGWETRQRQPAAAEPPAAGNGKAPRDQLSPGTPGAAAPPPPRNGARF